MGKSIKGTRTEKNLGISFAGESQARMRYTYYASAAKKEGYEQIAAIFAETADQEKEHQSMHQLYFLCCYGIIRLQKSLRTPQKKILYSQLSFRCNRNNTRKLESCGCR